MEKYEEPNLMGMSEELIKELLFKDMPYVERAVFDRIWDASFHSRDSQVEMLVFECQYLEDLLERDSAH